MKPPSVELHDLAPDPAETWQRMLSFVGLQPTDRQAMARTVEPLLQRAPELVIQTYNYLLSVPETAAILGWEQGADEAHLAERRRFFAVWLARTIGLDTSDEFAYYLFRAGKYHAGHGPRRIHTPPIYITGSIGLVQAAFATYMQEANLPGSVIAPAMAGWNKYLAVQLHLMLVGYQVARDLDAGTLPIKLTFFGRMRTLIGQPEMTAHVPPGATAVHLLNKFFSYHPQAQAAALERRWLESEKSDSLWSDPQPVYVPQWGWRVLRNGRDLTYDDGYHQTLQAHDTIAIFPPGR
jgi:molybdopterin converting factor small subunit